MEANAASERVRELRARHPFLSSASGVFAATLCSFLAVGAVLPVLPRYVHGPVGAGDVAVGIVIGAFAFTAVISRPLAGRLADARGRRIIVLWGSLIMGVAGALLLIPAGLPELVLARLVLGIGEGFVFTAGSTWIIDMSPVDRRAQSIGFFGLAVWTGLSAGPLIGEGLYSAGGYDLVWLFAALAPLAGAWICSRQPTVPPPVDEDPGPRRLLPAGAVGPGIALAFANAGYATLAGFVGLHLAKRGVGHGAAVFTAFAVSVVGTRLLLGRLPDRVGARPTAVAAGIAEAVGLALVAMATVWWTAVAGGIVMGLGFSMLYPSLALVVVERMPVSQRGAGLGAFTAFFDAGVGLGGPLAGAIAALAGYPAAFWAAAGFGATAALISAAVARMPTPASSPA